VVDPAAAATIFVVEDDPDMRDTLSKALRASGYRVLAAATGADARALFGEVQPDLVILDLMLPDSDGLLLAGALRTLTSAPIIICTARHRQIDRVLGSQLGAADFVTKPFELEDLEARIEAVLRRSNQQDESQSTQGDMDTWRSGHRARRRMRRARLPDGAPDE
jgi:DNA-binding response OmpR family regulator